jgi:hypothetical protein
VLKLGYDTGRFDDELINQFLRDYQSLLEQISEVLCLKNLFSHKEAQKAQTALLRF